MHTQMHTSMKHRTDLETQLTQEVIEGELVIVPDLEHHSSGDFALSLVQSPEGILTEKKQRRQKQS